MLCAGSAHTKATSQCAVPSFVTGAISSLSSGAVCGAVL